jgi:hypothetical protein
VLYSFGLTRNACIYGGGEEISWKASCSFSELEDVGYDGNDGTIRLVIAHVRPLMV